MWTVWRLDTKQKQRIKTSQCAPGWARISETGPTKSVRFGFEMGFYFLNNKLAEWVDLAVSLAVAVALMI